MLTANLRFHGIYVSLFVAVAVGCAQSALPIGSAVEVTLVPGEQRQFTVSIPGPSYFRLALFQQALPCQLTLSGPAFPRAEYASREFSQIRVGGILKHPGEYRATLALVPGLTQPSACRIILEELRATEPGDEAADSAYRAFWEAYHSWETGSGQLAGLINNLQRAESALHDARDERTRASTWWLIAEDQRRSGKHLESERSFARALSLSQTLSDILGECLAMTGMARPGGSRPDYEQEVVRILETRTGFGDWTRARVLEELGRANSIELSAARSVEYWRKSTALYRPLGDRLGLAKTLRGLSDALVVRGDFDDAIAAISESAGIYESLGNVAAKLNSLIRLGRIYQSYQMDEQKALDLFRLAANEAHRAGINEVYLEALDSAAASYSFLGDLQAALDVLLTIEQVQKNDGRKQPATSLMLRIATVKAKMGDEQGAAAIRGEALQKMRASMPPNPTYSQSSALAQLYYQLHDLRSARQTSEEALRVLLASSDRSFVVAAFGGLANLCEEAGDLKAAIEYGERGYQILEQVPNPRRLSIYTYGMARLYLRAGETAKAMESAQRALDAATQILDHQIAADVLVIIAKSQRATGNLEAAVTSAARAVDEIEARRRGVQSAELRREYFSRTVAAFDFYIGLLMELDARRPQEGFAARALAASERARARLLLEALNESHAHIRSGVDPELLKHKTSLERALAGKANALAALLGRRHTPAEEEEASRQVRMISFELRDLDADIRARSPRYAALEQPTPINTREIQSRLLDPKTILLDYWLAEEKSFVWAVTKDHINAYELPARGILVPLVREFYDLLTARSRNTAAEPPAARRVRLAESDRKLEQVGAYLSRMLLGPVAASLQGRRVAVVANDILQLIPFAALPDPQDQGQPLIAAHEVIALPSVSVLAELRDLTQGRPRPPKIAAVFADPVFDSADSRVKPPASKEQHATPIIASLDGPKLRAELMQRLPASRLEANAIAAAPTQGGVSLILGFEANRRAATDPNLGRYRIVHFATHAVLNSDLPELSGVVLSLVDQKGAPQEGFLRLQDVYDLNLPAELVVLSACETALGKDVRGEGLIGLARAFFYVGAKRVVSSLWKVDDSATARLMESFYRAMLRSGMTPSAALRNAQLQMLQQPLWRSPYYWAAFGMQGEWR